MSNEGLAKKLEELAEIITNMPKEELETLLKDFECENPEQYAMLETVILKKGGEHENQ